MRDLFSSGLVHPDAPSWSNSRTEGFVPQKIAVSVEGQGNSWVDFWQRGLVEGTRLEPSAQREQNESSCREDQECLLGGVSPRRHVPRQVGEHRVDGIPP